jgi:membrane AbrB-like protein
MAKLPMVLLSLGLGLIAGMLASLFKVPLPWMLGPLGAVMIASLCGVKLNIPAQLRSGSRSMVGLILGATVTLETLDRVHEWPLSLLLLVLGATLITVLSSLYFFYVARFDRLTSVSASLPGAISTIPLVAIQMGANPRQVVLPHLFRVTLIVLVVPPLFATWQGIELNASSNGFDFDLWGKNLWILLTVAPAWLLAKVMRFPIPELTGPLFVSAALSLAGYQLGLPDWLFALTFIVLGSSIGVRFYGMPWQMLAGTGRHALVGTFLTLAISALVAFGIHRLTDVPLPVALLAVTPGGIAEMAILAAALGVDPVFVAFHQIFRSILLNLLSPFLLRRFGGQEIP